MPAYGWLKNNKLGPRVHTGAYAGKRFPLYGSEISQLKEKTELDALIAYMQVIGTAVTSKTEAVAAPSQAK